MNAQLELIYQDIVNSVGYKTTVGPTDKSKVERRYAGQPTPLPSSRLGKAAWRTAALLKPLVPPPPQYLKVAPRVAYAQGGSDARFCMQAPGVTRRPDGRYTDESGAVYAADGDGLDESGIRSGEPAVTGAREIDGRPFCSLPTMGDPTKNTGSWKV